MKKLLPLATILLSIFFISCSNPNSPNNGANNTFTPTGAYSKNDLEGLWVSTTELKNEYCAIYFDTITNKLSEGEDSTKDKAIKKCLESPSIVGPFTFNNNTMIYYNPKNEIIECKFETKTKLKFYFEGEYKGDFEKTTLPENGEWIYINGRNRSKLVGFWKASRTIETIGTETVTMTIKNDYSVYIEDTLKYLSGSVSREKLDSLIIDFKKRGYTVIENTSTRTVTASISLATSDFEMYYPFMKFSSDYKKIKYTSTEGFGDTIYTLINN